MTLKEIILVLSLGLFAMSNVWSQRTISVEDPDITFGYSLPEGFANDDDSFYHYVYPDIQNGKETIALRLTYFEGFDGDLSAFNEGILMGKLYSTLDDFKIKESGEDIVDGTLAKWSTYSYSESGVEKCGSLYSLIQFRQYFEIHLQGDCKAYAKYEEDLKSVINSLEITRK